MSPVGTPDFGANVQSNFTAPLIEGGEGIVRQLMGAGSFSRTGRWAWATGFESGQGEFYVIGGSPALQPPQIDYTFSYMGVGSLHFFYNATVAEQGRFYKYLLPPYNTEAVNNRIGIEMMAAWRINGIATDTIWSIQAPYIEPATAQQVSANIKLSITGNNVGKLYYNDASNVYQQFADVGAYLNNLVPPMFHYAKLVIDINTARYVRFIFDGVEYPIDFPTRLLAGATPFTYYDTRFVSQSTTVNKCGLWIDNVIMTQDEP